MSAPVRGGAVLALAAFVAWAWSLTRVAQPVPGWYWSPLVGAATALVVAGILGLIRGPGDEPAPTERLGPADLLVPALLLAAGWWVQDTWQALQNPSLVMSGADHVSFVANVEAVHRAAWDDYNRDKPILHALLASLLVGEAGDYVAAALPVSKLSVAALPALAWALARPLYGRAVAAVAGLFVLADAEPWGYAVQATNYALYAATATACLAALAWYARRPGLVAAALVGLCLGAAMATSEKALLALAPAAMGALVITGARPWRRLADPLLTLCVAGAFVHATHPPVEYTPPGNFLVVQRGDMHIAVPWSWPAIEHPDPARPFPYAEHVPASLRSPSVDVTLAALTTPPHRNGLRLQRGALVEVPDTTTAPPEVLFASNVGELRRTRPLTDTRLLLLAAGIAGSLLSPRSRPAAALALALLSGLGPLFLKYQARYYLHLLPLAWVLSVGGLDVAARALAGGSRAGPVLGRGAAWGLVGALLVATLHVDPHGWRRPFALGWPPRWAHVAIDIEDASAVGASTRAVATWLHDHATPDRVHSCTPHPVNLYLPARWNLPLTQRDPACADLDGVATGDLVVVSDHRENQGVGIRDLAPFAGDGWELAAVARNGRLEVPARRYGPGVSVWVYRRTE